MSVRLARRSPKNFETSAFRLYDSQITHKSRPIHSSRTDFNWRVIKKKKQKTIPRSALQKSYSVQVEKMIHTIYFLFYSKNHSDYFFKAS